MIKEDLLHYIWQTKKFDCSDLRCTHGQSLHLIESGSLNSNAGPDFLGARIRVDDIFWAGNVEMHVLASDWYRHGHDKDPAYDNVILHVVFHADALVHSRSGHPIPCLELKTRILPIQLARYRQFRRERHRIPCDNQFRLVTVMSQVRAIEKALIQRLESKTEQIKNLLIHSQFHWDYSLIITMARNFGTNINADPFEQLLRSIPPNIFYRERQDLLNLEALLFGQAGFLEATFADGYALGLQERYRYQLVKYPLSGLTASQWRFLRTRPGNFPEKRIAQLAALLHKNEKFFDFFRDHSSIARLYESLDIAVSVYWGQHNRLGKPGPPAAKTLSRAFKNHLIINAVIPFYYCYFQYVDASGEQEQLLELMADVPPENNHVISMWKNLGYTARSAFDTQGLLQLKKGFCDKHKCLQCPVGQELMN